MARLPGMHEMAWRAGGGQRRGNLAPDVARLAHPGDDHVATGGLDQIGCAGECGTEIAAQRLLCGLQASPLDLERAPDALPSGGHWPLLPRRCVAWAIST